MEIGFIAVEVDGSVEVFVVGSDEGCSDENRHRPSVLLVVLGQTDVDDTSLIHPLNHEAACRVIAYPPVRAHGVVRELTDFDPIFHFGSLSHFRGVRAKGACHFSCHF